MHIITRTKNKKLGPRALVLDRPTGITCPSTCPLVRECYQKKMERVYPSIRTGALKNLGEVLQNATVKTDSRRPLRLHVGGDFYRDDRLDRKYLSAIIRLVRNRYKSDISSKTWTYTHCWRDPVLTRILNKLKRYGLTVLASVHSAEEAKEAASLGYRVAYNSDSRRNGPDVLQPLHLAGLKGIVCPEQLGTGLTCDRCGYCWMQKSDRHLVLLKH